MAETMLVAVLVREIFAPQTVRASRRSGALDTRRARQIMNPSDRCALEQALRLGEPSGARVVAIGLGEGEDVLREALAMGAHEAVLVKGESRWDIGIDESLHATILSRAIEKLGKVDIVIAGHRRLDLGTSPVGPQLAEILGWPCVARAQELAVEDPVLRAKSVMGGEYALVETALPAVITVDEGANEARYPNLARVMSVYKEGRLTTWSLSDLGLDLAALKESGAWVEIRETQAPPEREKETISGDAGQAARVLIKRLRNWGVVVED